VIILGALVTVSLLRGIHKGMKVFAGASMWILYAFMIIMLIMLPKGSFRVGLESMGSFFTDFIYNNIYSGRAVQNDWTVYYWIWWLSWSAFTAPFIVTISKGRSIRSIVFYTVLVPSALVAVYMILGNCIGMNLFNNGTDISMLPYVAINRHWIIPILFIILMGMFYVTSSDSQSFALDNLISKGSKTPVVYRKIMWVLLEVLFVAVLLLAGSGTTSALQGLSFLFTPLMIIFAIINIVYIILHYIKINK
jgi:choline/glycine/proline betaine transport protein